MKETSVDVGHAKFLLHSVLKHTVCIQDAS
jgi:hypothetical protein